MECLNEIVGLIRTDCDCITEGMTPEEKAELLASKSGLFVDSDLNGVINIRGMDQESTCKNIVQTFKDSRRAAVSKFKEDMFAGIFATNIEKNGFSGAMNKTSWIKSLDSLKTNKFAVIKPHRISDANMVIRNVQIGVNKSGLVTLKILKVLNGDYNPEVVFSKEVEVEKNKYTTAIVDYTCNFREDESAFDYFITWTSEDSEIMPLDNKTDCGCGKMTWKDYVTFQGGESDRLDTLHLAKLNGFAYGMVPTVTIHCHLDEFICREYENQQAVKAVVGWALLYKTGANIIDHVLLSGNIDRYTTMNREALYGKRNHFTKEYNERVQHLVASMDVEKSDCFQCKPSKMSFGLIRA